MLCHVDFRFATPADFRRALLLRFTLLLTLLLLLLLPCLRRHFTLLHAC